MVASPSLVTLLIWSGKPPEEERSCIHEFGTNMFIGFSTDVEMLFMCMIDMLYSRGCNGESLCHSIVDRKKIFCDFFAGTTLKEDLAVWELV